VPGACAARRFDSDLTWSRASEGKGICSEGVTQRAPAGNAVPWHAGIGFRLQRGGERQPGWAKVPARSSVESTAAAADSGLCRSVLTSKINDRRRSPAWTPEEVRSRQNANCRCANGRSCSHVTQDQVLTQCVQAHGSRNWKKIAQEAFGGARTDLQARAADQRPRWRLN
jgi:hypothetical protein